MQVYIYEVYGRKSKMSTKIYEWLTILSEGGQCECPVV